MASHRLVRKEYSYRLFLKARTMSTWLPMFALANIEVKHPIEVDGFALASIRDPRVQELANAHPNFQPIPEPIRHGIRPACHTEHLYLPDDAPVTYRGIDAIAGFRDAIAMSVIPQSWAKVLRFGNNMGIKYSDYFSVYPWMLDKSFEHLIASTLNMLGIHEVSKLHAQSSPALSREFFDGGPLDKPLLNGLLERWQRSFSPPPHNPTTLSSFVL